MDEARGRCRRERDSGSEVWACGESAKRSPRPPPLAEGPLLPLWRFVVPVDPPPRPPARILPTNPELLRAVVGDFSFSLGSGPSHAGNGRPFSM